MSEKVLADIIVASAAVVVTFGGLNEVLTNGLMIHIEFCVLILIFVLSILVLILIIDMLSGMPT